MFYRPNPIISLCIPVHNRLEDLKLTLPHLLALKDRDDDLEIGVLDYNSTDGLAEYVKDKPVNYRRYTGRPCYHMAHARNLSVLMTSGEYFVILSADIYLTPDFLPYARWLMAAGCTWMYDELYKGVIVCWRREFLDAGGYDERFEFYGPEDRELHARLVRRKTKHMMIPRGMVKVLHTPDRKKTQGYRLPLSKQEMHERGMLIYTANNNGAVLRANPDGWGSWN